MKGHWLGVLVTGVAAVSAQSTAEATAAATVLAQLEPNDAIAFHLLADTDGDGRAELVLVTKTGLLRRYGMSDGAGLVSMGTLQLRDPTHSLVACRDIDAAAGQELIVADPSGTAWLPWPTGDQAPAPHVLSRRARFLLRVDTPQASPFVQDLDHDGRLDLLLPTMQGCLPLLQAAAVDGAPQFRTLPLLPLPVQVTLDASNGSLDDEHRGGLVVPQVETADLNGDGRPDLITRDGSRHAFHLQTEGGGFAAPIEVDLLQFEDSTPSTVTALGSTLVLGDRQLLQRGDIDGDGIPDFVIAHRRKIWTFRSSTDGPQFVQARIQAVADDVSGMLLVDLDEDQRSDLLAFQVQLPSIGSLLLGLVQSIDIDVKAVGYRSEQGAFANLPAWRRTVTLRVPPLLSLLSRQEELVQRFLGILGKARQSVRGSFVSTTPTDLALVSADGTKLELYPQANAPTLGSAQGRQLLRRLLFEDPETVFDLERMFGLLSGLLDQRTASLTGDASLVASITLRDPTVWQLTELLASNLEATPRDEVVAVYTAVQTPSQRAYDVLSWPAPTPR